MHLTKKNSKNWMIGCVTVKQTQMYVCTLEEECILVNTNSLLYKLELVWQGNYTGIYKMSE